MKQVLQHIHARSEVFADEPMFHYLNDRSIPVDQKLCFMPMMAHFVFSFMDINKFILRNEEGEVGEYQRLINIHTYEDATHWPWWINDLKAAGLDKSCSFTDAVSFIWSEATNRSRALTYEFISIVAKATPRQLLAIVETVESTGYKFLSATAEVCGQINDNPYQYYGRTHANVESGHHMGTDDAEAYLEAIVLSGTERAEIMLLVDRLYQAYTDFVAEMHDWVMSHDIKELRLSEFFMERVTGELSQPLSKEELIRFQTPVGVGAQPSPRLQ